jgi:hypothetical protein
MNELFAELNVIAETYLKGDGFFGVVGLDFGGLITIHRDKTKQLDTLARAFAKKEGGSADHVAYIGPAGVRFEKRPEAPEPTVDLDAFVDALVQSANDSLLRDRDSFSPVGLMTLSDGQSGIIHVGSHLFGEESSSMNRALAMVAAGRRAAEISQPLDLLQFIFCSECWLYPGGDRDARTPGLVFTWVRPTPGPAMAQGGRTYSVIEQGDSLDLIPHPQAKHSSFLTLAFAAGFQSIRTADPHFALFGQLAAEMSGSLALGGHRTGPIS